MVVDDFKLLDVVSANEDPFQIAVHTPVRIWTDGGALRMAFLDSDWIEEQAGRLLPTAPMKDRTLITAPRRRRRRLPREDRGRPPGPRRPGFSPPPPIAGGRGGAVSGVGSGGRTANGGAR